MKGVFGEGYSKKPQVIWFLSLITALLCSAAAQASSTLTCRSCHEMPPIDSTTRNVVTGGFVGNHQTHLPIGATITNCALCHNASGYQTTHMDGAISIKKQLNGATTTTTYSSPGMVDGGTYVFKNQTSLPRLGACSNANCHFEKTSPVWGSANFAYTDSLTNDCDKCHGLPPAGTVAASGAAGAHAKHYSYYVGAEGCAKCHANHLTETAKFAHASSVGNRSLIVSLKDPSNLAGGTYSGVIDDYLPSQTNTFGSCSNLYCHSDGTKASGVFRTKSNATWGGSVVANCAGCHGGTLPALQNVISTNRHISHINNISAVGRTIGCQECHAATTNGTSILTMANHVDKLINIKFDDNINRNADGPTYNGALTTGSTGSAKTAGSVASCANVYCHSIGNTNATGAVVSAGGTNFKSISWNASSVGCSTNSCHGNGTYSYPVYATGGSGSDIANNHIQHVRDRGFDCGYCHAATTANGTAINGTNPALHVNRSENVDFKSYGGNTGSYNSSKQCSNTYCHSNGNEGLPLAVAQWGGVLDCRGCHGGDASHANPIATNKHSSHVNPFFNATLGADTGIVCAQCHIKTVGFSNNTTITTQSSHVNALKDYSGVRAGSFRLVYGQRTCSNVYCHSSGQKIPEFRNMTGSRLWNGAAALTCNGCHGYRTTSQGAAFDSIAGSPNYANGGVGNGNANSHKTHVADKGTTDSRGCAYCHDHTVSSTVADKFKDYTTQHTDGTRDVIFSANVGGTYNLSNQSCSNTKCHGNSSAPQWGGLPLPCNSCHGVAFRSFSSASKKGAHKQHYETDNFSTYTETAANKGTATAYQFTCQSCHAAPAGHSDLTYPTPFGVAQVYFGFTSAGKKPSYNYGGGIAGTDSGAFTWTGGGSSSCNNTYCHSNGKDGQALLGVSWNSTEGTLGPNCLGCHGNESSSGGAVLSGRHDSHINNLSYLGTNFTCSACHAKTITNTNNRTIADKRNHVNKFRDYSGRYAGKQPNFNGSNCTNIYCHSNGKAAYATTPSWSAMASPLSCTACHTYTLSHSTHLNATYQGQPVTCAYCHNNTAAGNSALKVAQTTHINGTYNVNGIDVKFAMFSSSWKSSYAGTTCSNIYCHSDGHGRYQPVQWGSTLDCNSCHPFTQLTAGHAKHIDVSQTSVFYTYTANRSGGDEGVGGAVYRFGCSNCHPLDEATYHTNGTIDVTLRPATGAGSLKNKNVNIMSDGINIAGSGIAKSGANLTCRNVYCHTNGYTANMNWTNTTPVWIGTFTNADRCANCHGNSPSVGVAGSPAHAVHVVGIHADDIFKGTSGKLLAGRGGTFGNTTSVSHGSAVQATTINCNICHNATVTYSYNDRSSSCITTDCHATGSKSAQINNRSFHVNGRVDVVLSSISVVSKAQLRTSSFNDYTAAGGYWTRNGGATPNYKNDAAAFDTAKAALSNSMWSSGTCSNISCHMGRQVTWTTTISCEGCHSKL